MATRPCLIEGCRRPAGVPGSARGWCQMHYRRWQRRGTTDEWTAEPFIPTICSIEGCGRPAHARGWCPGHYRRWLLTETVSAEIPLWEPRLNPPKKDPWTLFWDKVHVTDDCWIFTGAVLCGYGVLAASLYTETRAHRYAFTQLVGPIPDGFHLHHVCRNRACVNPAHLEPMSPQEHSKLHHH